MKKSNPIPSGWATHKQENNSTKEVLATKEVVKVLTPNLASPPEDLVKGLGIPRESNFEGQ